VIAAGVFLAVEAAAVWLVVKTPPPSGGHCSGRQTLRRAHGRRERQVTA
jgi:hypothetical protein